MIHESAESTGSPERLWELISDIDRWAERIPTVNSIRHIGGPAEPAVGSRYELEQPGTGKGEYEITEWDPAARRFVWQQQAPGVTVVASHAVVPTPTGSRLNLDVEFSGILGRTMGRLMKKRATAMVRSEAETFARLAGQD